MGKYDANRNCWSGLFSGGNYNWQEGLRQVSARIGDMAFFPTSSGYAGWDKVADSVIARRPNRVLWMGHSNGAYACTKGAERVGKQCPEVEHVLIIWDCTLKACPPIGKNVVAVMEIWAGLARVKFTDDFRGDYAFRNYEHESHTGVIGNPDAQNDAVNFAKKWM